MIQAYILYDSKGVHIIQITNKKELNIHTWLQRTDLFWKQSWHSLIRIFIKYKAVDIHSTEFSTCKSATSSHSIFTNSPCLIKFSQCDLSLFTSAVVLPYKGIKYIRMSKEKQKLNYKTSV